jgi:hypothetical protein
MASSFPVVIATDQKTLTTVVANVVTASLSGAIPVGGNAIGTVTALQGAAPWSQNITQIGGTAIAIGSTTMASSFPVVIATDQKTLTALISNASVTALISNASVTALISNASVTALISNASLTANITQVSGTNLILGSSKMASSIPVTIATDQASLTTIIANASLTTLVTNASLTTLVTNALMTVNLTAVGGVPLILGSGRMASSIPVTIATDQATVTINLGQVLGQATVTAGIAGVQAIGGPIATGASVGAAYPVLTGGRTQTGEIASTATGQASFLALDKVGKQIMLLYANPENFVAGAASSIATTLTQVIASVNATNKIYVTSMQLGNLSGSTIFVTFNDPKISLFVLPAGGGNNPIFPTPLAFTLGSAVSFTCSLAVSTVTVNVQGYSGQ